MTNEQRVIEAARAILKGFEGHPYHATLKFFDDMEALHRAMIALDAESSGPKKWGVYSIDRRGIGRPQLEAVHQTKDSAVKDRDRLAWDLASRIFEIREMGS